MDILNLLQQPFLLRAIYGGLIVSILCAILGVFVTLRKESFLSDAVAHASLAGVAIALLLSIEPTFFALAVGILMAIGITYIKKHTQISADAIIGIFFSVLFALGIVILSLSTSYKPELSTYLFGSILSISWDNILISGIIFVITVILITIFYSQLVYSTLDKEAAYIRGIKIHKLEYLLSILTSVTVIISIKVVGIVLVTALLIIPATSAKLVAKSFKQMIPISIIISILSTILGIFISYYQNTPTGATIVIVAGVIFTLILITNKLLAHYKKL